MFNQLDFFVLWLILSLILLWLFKPNSKLKNQKLSSNFFKFIFKFPSGGSLKGVVKGDLQSDKNTVTNLSDLFAVYYADFIPPKSENLPSETLPPLVFDRFNLELNDKPQFTLNGNQLISFSGTNNKGDLFNIQKSSNEVSVIIKDSEFPEEIDSFYQKNKKIKFPFKAENVIYQFGITASLKQDSIIPSATAFPQLANIKGFILFPNNIDKLKRVNQEFAPTPAVDYPFMDSLFIFSDENDTPKYALVPDDKESTFTAINPGGSRSSNKTPPTNPETSELVIFWDIGYIDPNNTNEVLTTNGGSDLFLPVFKNLRSQFTFFDMEGQTEATYEVITATLTASSNQQSENPNSYNKTEIL